MKLYLYTLLDDEGYPNTGHLVARDKTHAEEQVSNLMEDYHIWGSAEEVEVDGYSINVKNVLSKTESLKTDGWIFAVGQVYSSPYQPAHVRIAEIEPDVNGEPSSAFIKGVWVSPKDHSLEVDNPDEFDQEFHVRAWYMNENYSLEKDVY